MSTIPSSEPPLPEGSSVPFVVDEETHQTWYKIYGDLASSKSVPLVVIHGGKLPPLWGVCVRREARLPRTSRSPTTLLGPGMVHDYLTPVGDLERPVIFYDQLGNGRSTHLREKPEEFWTIDLFIDELINLVQRLGISSRYDILGHSWGGMLASEFVIRRPHVGLRKLVIISSLPSMELWNTSFKNLVEGLQQARVQETIQIGPIGENKVKFRQALEVLYSRHGCTRDPPPEEISSGVLDPIFGDRETGEGGDPTVYAYMCVSCEGIQYFVFLTLGATGRRDLLKIGTSSKACTRSTSPLFC